MPIKTQLKTLYTMKREVRTMWMATSGHYQIELSQDAHITLMAVVDEWLEKHPTVNQRVRHQMQALVSMEEELIPVFD